MTVEAAALPVAGVPVVRAYVRQVVRNGRSSRVLGIRAQPVWAGPQTLDVDGATVRVRACVSALAVREALTAHATERAPDHGGDFLVVITDVGDDDLGHGIRALLADGRLLPVRLWETVRESFRAKALDPLLTGEKDWAARALVDHEPPGGWPAAPGGVLTRDVALGHLAAEVLGKDAGGVPYVDGEHVDAAGLLRWSLDRAAVGRWRELLDPVRAGLGDRLADRTGDAGRWTLRAVEAGRGADAVPLGLVAGLLWHDAGGTQAAVAQGRLSALVGGAEIGAAEARGWARTVTAFVAGGLSAGDPAVVAAVDRAERLLADLHAADVATLSDQLPAAFTRRLRGFAAALRRALPTPAATPAAEALSAAESAYERLRQHDLAARDRRADVATMALRLLRWLAVAPAPGTPGDEVATLAEALSRQVRTDAWVDRAYADVWDGDPDPEVGRGYADLAGAVAARRARHDEQIARLLVRVSADDPDLGRIVPVEDAMERVLRPLAEERRVLLVVVDGMSTAVAAEVVEGLRARRWSELVDGGWQARQALLPTLPTVTETCRTSLLTGRLRTGTQADEKAGFAAAVGDPNARLFHKDDLRAPAGRALAAEVEHAIADPDVRVVGVVLNTVDDALDKMDPGGTTWTLEQIQRLGPLLDAARTAGRLVVLTADHGHVVERGSRHRPAPDATSARSRPPSSPAGDGEVLIRGRRVLLGDGPAGGRAVVVPWREGLRYTARHAGYHGGASAAEVAVPLTVHAPSAVDAVAGWVAAVPPEPPWWLSPLAPQRPNVVTAAPPAGTEAAPTLFDEQPAAPAGDPVTTLVEALLASGVYAAQRSRAGRHAPDDRRVRAIVAALLRNDGRLHETTLAAAADVPATRLRQVLTGVRRLLSVEGYEALRVDPDGVTVVLDVPTLREQFGLRDAT